LVLGSNPSIATSQAEVTVDWANTPIDVMISISDFDQVLITATNIPLNRHIKDIFRSITGFILSRTRKTVLIL